MLRKNIQNVLMMMVPVILVSLVSCNPSKKYEKEETSKIDTYVNSNPNLSFVVKPSGLYYYEVQAGAGRAVVPGDTAYVKYTGKFLDGTVFDTNVGKVDSLIFPVAAGWMIYGFDEGISYMREGGKAILLVPSNLAYGSSGFYSIPGYTPLLYDVELVKVVPKPGK
jgi:FKBP-type peptidyl-prolyl cis-trans isomerase